MLLAVCSANAFLKTLYHGGLWLSATESSYVIAEGQKCLKHFQRCAERAFHLEFTRWKLQPKFHMLGEVLFEMGTLRMAGKPVPNPLTYSCQMDEDLVGRVSAFSRVVSSRTIHERTLSRYQVALAGKWWWKSYLICTYVPLKKNQVLKIYLFCCTVPRFQLPRSRKKARAGPSPFIEALVRAHCNPREVSSESWHHQWDVVEIIFSGLSESTKEIGFSLRCLRFFLCIFHLICLNFCWADMWTGIW